MIPYGKQFIDNEDINSVINVLKSNYLTQGPLTPKFESLILKKTKSKYAVATNSGTSALHISCLALGLKKNDLLWTSPNSFIASANCAEYCGASVDFVDIDFKTGNVDSEYFEEKLKNAKKKNKLPKIFIPVHFGGQPTDQSKIWKLAKKYNVKIIEDASHSLGAKNHNEQVGSCKFSDITVTSFHPVKTITTAEGGVALTNSIKLFNRLKEYRVHGVVQANYKYNGSFCSYFQKNLGYNYRLSDIHSAIGISQISKINKFIIERRKIYTKYINAFENSNIEPIKHKKNYFSSNHLFVIRPKYSIKKFSNIKAINFLRQKGLGVNSHYFPIHLQPYYRKKGFKIGSFPNAEKHGKISVSIPIFVGLTAENQDKIIKILNNYYNEFEYKK